MIELETLQMIREIVTIFGVIAGVSYYVLTVRNAQKNRMVEFVFQRMHERNPEYMRTSREVEQMGYGWSTVEEFYEKYNYLETPELTAKRNSIVGRLNAWGFLLKEGLIELDFISRLHTPSFIISMWERNEPLFLDFRERANDPTIQQDFEYLYNAVKRKYPDIHESKFAWDEARERILEQRESQSNQTQ
ncbi:MAG: DUF4760 domain-containing protein [Candidatus Thorarchaeota archaeon]|jgi:hypothetical protein